jgi:hypothetical protein
VQGCHSEPRVVVSAKQVVDHVEVSVVRAWSDDVTGRSGQQTAYYGLRTAASGQPYRFYSVTEDNNAEFCPRK